ncbi:MED6 mediator sub complex component-domain-containing protein [Tribonema minus]|uniref:Mediator of RNA polymerase II transcription subunit 6 n=1 Tax=Tribonema minus TaxID=303371 RepID=A0A835YVL9_9STRA|nr:MED6 mediator sub complex component-domain-containing protein [Tribonema minus]
MASRASVIKAEQDEIEDQTQLSFQDTMWLRSFYLGPETAIDYFALSPFYDRTSNNELCRMQGLTDHVAAMQTMTGIEYVVEELPPETDELPEPGAPPQPRHLMVIKKQYRKSKTQAEVRGVYYIMDGTIYQAPSALALITSRLQKAAFMLSESFAALRALPAHNARGAYDWPWNAEAAAAAAKHGGAAAAVAATAQSQAALSAVRAGADAILLQLVSRYARSEGEGGAAAVAAAAATLRAEMPPPPADGGGGGGAGDMQQ